MEAELRFHLELEAEALIGRGLDPAAAHDTARRRFGSVALVKDDCRESGGMGAIEQAEQEVRYGQHNIKYRRV